jgi:hypothetical protein
LVARVAAFSQRQRAGISQKIVCVHQAPYQQQNNVADRPLALDS